MAQSAVFAPQSGKLSPQQQFVASLGSRLKALSEALTGLESEPYSVVRRNTLRRRLEAMAEASRALGFDAVATAFTSAETTLANAAEGLSARDLKQLTDTLELVPSLVPDELEERQADASSPLVELGPAKVVCLGLLATQTKLKRVFEAAPNLSFDFTVELEDSISLAEKYEPELVLIDARRVDAQLALGRLLETAPCAVLEADAVHAPEFERLGACHVGQLGDRYEDLLYTALQSRNKQPPTTPERTEVSVLDLVDDITHQLHTALIDDMERGDPGQRLQLGGGGDVQGALWSTIARLRALIAERSGNSIRYAHHGPEGAVVIASERGVRQERSAANPENLRGRKVLVADDDPAITWFLSSVLRAAGATVLEADDGLKAWDLARREVVDLVISDVMMPKLDGFALCRNMKRDVVLSDVPVVLLSWKEDLLQRVRELGVGADGYLPKEAEAPEIVERCAEALRARAKVEKRLREERVVYGRLDGLTPRLVLSLVCETPGSAKVVFHDAAFTYEAQVGEGRLLAVSRVSTDGVRETGEDALPGLLGMRAGRFVVEKGGDKLVQAELCGTLDAVLAPYVQRARAALRQVRGVALHNVARLELNPESIGPYKRTSPAIVARLVEKLEAGIAPSSLLRSVSAGLLESVLLDLATRGAINHAFDEDERDLLEIEPMEEAELFDVDVHTPQVGEAVLPAAGAPKVSAHSSEEDAGRAAEFTENLQERIAESRQPPRVIPLPDSVAHQPEPTALMPGNIKHQVAPSAELDLADAVLGELSATPAAPRAKQRAVRPFSLPTKVEKPAHAPKEAPRFEPGLAAHAAAEAAAQVAPVAATAPEPAPAVSDTQPKREISFDDPTTVGSEPLLQKLGAPPKPTALNDAKDWGRKLRGHLTKLGELLTKDPESETPPVVQTHAPEPSDVAQAAEPSTGAFASPQEPVAPAQSASPVQVESTAPAVEQLPPDPRPPSESPVIESESPGVRPALMHGLGPKVVGAGKRAARVAGPLGIVGIAAFGAFSLVGSLTASVSSPSSPAEPASEMAAATADHSAVGAAAAARVAEVDDTEPESSVEDIGPPDQVEKESSSPQAMQASVVELPKGIRVAPGKGLLEVNTGGRHKIYVGGVFVGRGPVRRVPLKPGNHSVETQLDGQRMSYEAEVVEARRTKLEAPQSSGTAALR